MAATVTGSSHNKVGQPCQDRMVAVADLSGWILIAVSDGAGTAAMSDIGAEVATETAVASLRQTVSTGAPLLVSDIVYAMTRARSAVLARAEDELRESRDYACTLIVAAVGPRGSAVGQIGDGVVCVRPEGDDWSWVIWPQRGEYANVTRFITDEDACDQWEVHDLPGQIVELGAMTDGLEPLALHYATQSVHSPFFEGLIPALRTARQSGEVRNLSEHLATFLSSPRVRDRVDDDLTLVLASRVDHQGS